ncbi:FAD-binding oxidoreductase [Variovorax paradoxus]|uniref:FAD-binding oxidoreductase n=1 Tax=Variovorax paradoxus TaxID=34073 RepID=UPI0021ACE32B|nr:FAD-binding oxidoreductase [Variovorax paradoxus]UVH56625.1 FAD-binding oxidoreductase [Variovorax paradoxus]
MNSSARLSWGRYPHHPQTAHAVHWPSEVEGAAASALAQGSGGTLAFGMGRSYGDSCMAASDHVVAMAGMDRVIAADWETGVVVAQAGLTLGALIDIALPRGWFLPVTPGTKFVTLGGAVANDVHGKNHHVMGTFGCHIRRLALFRTQDGVVDCSPQDNAELFRASVGGLGLTGIVLSVEIQLRRVPSAYMAQRSIKFGGLDEFFDLSEQLDAQHEYAVAWVDCLATGRQAGRGHYIVGNHAQEGGLQVSSAKPKSMPVDPPVSLVNAASLRVFNTLYYHRQQARQVHATVGYDPFFYPLDKLLHWNRMYGRAGFQQYQCVVPFASSRDAIRAVLAEIARSGSGSFLAVLKRCGDVPSPGLLSFPLPGVSLALDFAQRDIANARLFAKLDALIHEAGGRLYPAKDAHMSAVHFQQAYPAWPQVEALRDPHLKSRFWNRVTP